MWGSCGRAPAALLVFVVLAVGTLAASRSARAQGDWEVGQLIGLSRGTCIREGPGLTYRAHTRVPEDGWTVLIIDGPRQADGVTWYNTSRREAGDPSGGTGWVAQSQNDMCAERETPGGAPQPQVENWLARLRDWWTEQGAAVKWSLAIVVLGSLVALWNRLALSGWAVLRLVILGVVIWWVLDLTRDLWSTYWYEILGDDAPDLALLLGLAPALSWLIPRLLSRGRRR